MDLLQSTIMWLCFGCGFYFSFQLKRSYCTHTTTNARHASEAWNFYRIRFGGLRYRPRSRCEKIHHVLRRTIRTHWNAFIFLTIGSNIQKLIPCACTHTPHQRRWIACACIPMDTAHISLLGTCRFSFWVFFVFIFVFLSLSLSASAFTDRQTHRESRIALAKSIPKAHATTK